MLTWNDFNGLVGRTLKTLDRNRAFDVVEMNENSIVVRPHYKGKLRQIPRREIEPALKHLLANNEIARTFIRDNYSQFNPAYVAALLAALPKMKAKQKPIRIYWQGD